MTTVPVTAPDHYAWNVIAPDGVNVVDVGRKHLECKKEDSDYYRVTKRDFAERHLAEEIEGQWQ